MKRIDSTSNPYIKDLAKLKNKKHIQNLGIYLVEGNNIIEEAIKANVVRELLVTSEDLYKDVDVNKVIVSEQIIEKLSSNVSNEGAIAVCEIVEPYFDLESFNKVVVLDSINNPGNFGNIIRTAKALGYEAVVTLGKSVYKYNSKVISGTQGAIFGYPVIQIDGYEHNLKQKPYFFVLEENSKTIEEVELEDKFALVFGNEANGITKELIEA
jgi:TrmH family RNA methyltransferase